MAQGVLAQRVRRSRARARALAHRGVIADQIDAAKRSGKAVARSASAKSREASAPHGSSVRRAFPVEFPAWYREARIHQSIRDAFMVPPTLLPRADEVGAALFRTSYPRAAPTAAYCRRPRSSSVGMNSFIFIRPVKDRQRRAMGGSSSRSSSVRSKNHSAAPRQMPGVRLPAHGRLT